MTDALARALAAGATLVTPNRRLARHLAETHDRDQREAGKRAWPSPRILPWTAWTGEMENEATAAGALPPLARLPLHASAWLWRSAVDEDGASALDPGALASSAAEAWEHVQAYGSGAESWRAWSGGDDEPAAFARWAERYRATMAMHRVSDPASAANRVVSAAPAMEGWRGREIAFAGFLELTPQQRRVAEALERAGGHVDVIATVEGAAATPRRAEFASPDTELRAALAWARQKVEHRPDTRVGIVVPDLAARLNAVRVRAIDILGVPEEGDGRAQAWNLSLGPSIDSAPVVGAALDLIALAWLAVPAGRAAALLRSAHLPGATGPMREVRASVERDWLERGVDPVRIIDAIAALESRGDDLARRLSSVRASASRVHRGSRHAWIDAWREVLANAGWPGERTLASEEHQALRAFDEHLVSYAALDTVAGGRGHGEIGADEAIAALVDMLAGLPFQPESPPAPIQILGLYEAIGLPFDALWVAGMNDETLPRASRPHPLLPVRWQREHGVPRSDAARELAYARDVASWLLRASPDVVVSHAASIEDRPSVASAVFPAGDRVTMPVPVTPAQAMFEIRPPGERFVDAVAPALAADEYPRAGSPMIAAQSDCPFQALSARRWRADPWPEPVSGLTSLERGNLVHAALAAFWSATRSHAALVALSADPSRYAEVRGEAARAAIATISAARWRRVPAAVRALEEERLTRLVAEWLDSVELARPPFEVLGIEHQVRLALGPLALDLRPDRVDGLADGGVAIIDYKSGGVPSIARWAADRPEATQLALYTLAWRAAHPDSQVRATVLGKVKRGDVKPVGLYADNEARFREPSRNERVNPVVDWPVLETRWGGLMHGLAVAFASGEAAVSPRNPAVCSYCKRHALCRIGARIDVNDPGEVDEDFAEATRADGDSE